MDKKLEFGKSLTKMEIKCIILLIKRELEPYVMMGQQAELQAEVHAHGMEE